LSDRVFRQQKYRIKMIYKTRYKSKKTGKIITYQYFKNAKHINLLLPQEYAYLWERLKDLAKRLKMPVYKVFFSIINIYFKDEENKLDK